MALDFIKFINDTATNLTVAKKAALLADFCEVFQYQEQLQNPITGEMYPNPQTKKEFANEKIQSFIIQNVHELRRRKAEESAAYEKLEIK